MRCSEPQIQQWAGGFPGDVISKRSGNENAGQQRVWIEGSGREKIGKGEEEKNPKS